MRGWFSGDVVKRLGEERRTSERQNNLRLYKIIWCLLFIADEKPIDSIADLLDISTRTVRGTGCPNSCSAAFHGCWGIIGNRTILVWSALAPTRRHSGDVGAELEALVTFSASHKFAMSQFNPGPRHAITSGGNAPRPW